MSTPTRANGGLLRLPPGDLTQLTGEQFDDLILSCLEETGTSRQLWSSFLGWARANKHDPERLSRLPTMKKCSRVYSPSPATDRAVSRWLRVRPAQVEPHYPLPVDLPTDTTLDAVRTIPYGDGASIYPAHLHTWPQGSEAATNEVIQTGFAIFSQIVQSDPLISSFAYVCHPIPPGSEEDFITVNQISRYQQLLPPNEIRANILANLPTIVVCKRRKIDDCYMSTLLVQNQILVSRQLFDVCIKETNESNKLKLSVLWAICLLHEIAHVLMFRFGYGGRLHPISNQPFKTPGGVLLGEAGFFVEMTLITGLIHWSHRGKQFDGVFLRLDDGRSLRCPIAWLQRFVDRETYTNATETTFRFDPGQSSPLRGSRYRRTTHDLHVAEIFERSPEPRSFAVSVESFGPDEAWSEEERTVRSLGRRISQVFRSQH